MTHQLTLKTSKEDFIDKYLQAVNGIFNLSKTEKAIVKYIIKRGCPVIDKEFKAELQKNVKFPLPYLVYLKNKNIFIETDKGLILHPKLFTPEILQSLDSGFDVNIRFKII